MKNVEELKALYTALGGEPSAVENAETVVDVLNAIAAKYEGAQDAKTNPAGIANIAEVAGNISPNPKRFTIKIYNLTSKDINVSSVNADNIPYFSRIQEGGTEAKAFVAYGKATFFLEVYSGSQIYSYQVAKRNNPTDETGFSVARDGSSNMQKIVIDTSLVDDGLEVNINA